MKIVLVVLVFLSLLPFTREARAGTGTHGGQGVICKNAQGKITSVELADYYEGENTLPGTALDMGPVTGFYMDNINYVLNKLARIDSVAADRYRTRALAFQTEWELSTHALNKIDDAHEPINMDPGCEMAQFAIQNYPVKPLQRKYLVDQSIWKAADPISQAGLVLHEVIYTDALELGQTTSDNTRYYNYIISSTALNGAGGNSLYETVIASVGFDQSQCKFSWIADSLPMCLGRGMLAKDSPFILSTGQVVTAHAVQIQNGHVTAITLSSPAMVSVWGNQLPTSSLGLNPDRTINKVGIVGNAGVKVNTPAGAFPFAAEITFFLGGIVSSGNTLDSNVSTTAGTFIIRGPVTFYPDGKVRSVYLLNTDSNTYRFDAKAPAIIGGLKLQIHSFSLTENALTCADISGGCWEPPISFDENGAVIGVAGTDPFQSTLRDSKVNFNSAIEFYSNGQVKTGLAQAGQTLIDTQGKSVKLLKRGGYPTCLEYDVTLDSNGFLTSYKCH